MKIFHCPIEAYSNRYTADWIQQFENAFKESDIEFVTIGDTTMRSIEDGDVLDATGTHTYKFAQLTELMRLIKLGEVTDDDVVFFADGWFPGVESLFYVKNVMGLKFKVAGILHAGTWDPFDFTCRYGMREWGRHLEMSWLNGFDMLFVATQFHKDLIVFNSGEFDYDKIYVTGIPFYSENLRQQYPEVEKEDIIVFPHRIAPEKQPKKFDRLRRKYKKSQPDWKFVKTMDVTKTREEYFQLLAKSKVMISYAQQETFGFSTVEALALGNYVIVPNSLSYRETVPDHMRYNNEREIPEMLEKFMAMDTPAQYDGLLYWKDSIKRMVDIMGGK